MNYNLDIQKMLLESDKQTNPEDRIEVLKQAIKIADNHNDMDWRFDLRMDLIRAEQYTNHSHESLSAFAWILDAYDNDPQMFSEEEILQEYKWLAGVVFNNLNIPIQQIDNILDDFRYRLEKGGYSSREYFNIKINQSLFKGEKILAREYLDLRDQEHSDAMSSAFNDLITTIYVEMLEGDFDRALAHAADYVANNTTHQMNVIPIYSGLIYYMGGKKYEARVEKYFDAADEEFSNTTKYAFQLYEMSLMMYYMAKYRKERAWEYFEQFVNWEIASEEAVRFDFALSVLPLLKDGGMRTIEVISIRHPYYREDSTYDLNDLYEYYLDLAFDIGKRFDERNGNNHFADQINEELEFIKASTI